MHIGILTDFPSPSAQSGPAIHTGVLRDGLVARGHRVSFMGPDTSRFAPIPEGEHLLFPGFGYPTHPRVRIALPPSLKTLMSPPRVDLIHGQVTNHMGWHAAWMRRMWRIPFINTYTVHVPTYSHQILSDWLYRRHWIRRMVMRGARSVETSFARLYNQGDLLIVQSRFLVDYWRERGVTTPIAVVGRPINDAVFSRPVRNDPFPPHFRRGKRLLVACRHDREKDLDRIIEIFDAHVAPHDQEATLTLVGSGAHHRQLKAFAEKRTHARRIFMPGEVPHRDLVDWYKNASVFVYASLSETFGNVVNEALWTGLPVVAFVDGMGVSHQVEHGVNGFLVPPEDEQADRRFGELSLWLLNHRDLRHRLSENACRRAQQESRLERILSKIEDLYGQAAEHCRQRVVRPLAEQSRLLQRASLFRAVASWLFWNGSLLAAGHTAATIGSSPRDPADRTRPPFHEAPIGPLASERPGTRVPAAPPLALPAPLDLTESRP